MKTKFAWIGILALALVACEEKKEVKQTPTPEEKKRVTKTTRPPRPAAVITEEPAATSGMNQSPADDVGIAQTQGEGSEETAPQRSARAAWIPSDPETARLQEERRARMAAQRTTQMSEQLSNRFRQQDTNGDGLLAKDELNGRMQERFAEADQNGDGFLDATEQAAMIQGVTERFGQGGEGGPRRGRGEGGRPGGGGRDQNRRDR